MFYKYSTSHSLVTVLLKLLVESKSNAVRITNVETYLYKLDFYFKTISCFELKRTLTLKRVFVFFMGGVSCPHPKSASGSALTCKPAYVTCSQEAGQPRFQYKDLSLLQCLCWETVDACILQAADLTMPLDQRYQNPELAETTL